jgi:orotate phosphoribosyltransferase
VEGSVAPGEAVAIVDDVCTSGQSTIKALEAAREFGLKVAQVIVLVDRQQQDGMANIQKAAGEDVPVSAVFTKSDVKTCWAGLPKK